MKTFSFSGIGSIHSFKQAVICQAEAQLSPVCDWALPLDSPTALPGRPLADFPLYHSGLRTVFALRLSRRRQPASRVIVFFTHITFFPQFLCDAVLTDHRFIRLHGAGADTAQ